MGEAAENLNTTATAVVPILEAFKVFEHFCKSMLDAYVVIDKTGRIHKCNALFGQLVGQKTKQILKFDTVDDILSLSVAGKRLRLSDLVASPVPTRIDEVSGSTVERKDLNLIIGLYPFHQDGEILGAFILLRDVTAETNLQDKYKDKATASITDALTGLFNRSYFNEYLESQLATLESFPPSAPQRTLSVVMLDIDFFKKINDGFSHQAGDHVLRLTAELMRKSFRKTDIIARYGGEEFLAILPGTDANGACIAAEKLRQSMESFVFEWEGKKIPVTMSSGVAQVEIGAETGTQAIGRADQALYHSKKTGRNRVSIHKDGQTVPSTAKPA